jgi:hypothetical protein
MRISSVRVIASVAMTWLRLCLCKTSEEKQMNDDNKNPFHSVNVYSDMTIDLLKGLTEIPAKK